MRNILVCLAALATACVAQDIGHIENFGVTDFGSDYIIVCWDLVGGTADYPIHKYSLLIDSDLTTEFRCSDPSCCKTVYDLESCIEHIFDLTPIFYKPDGGDINGDVATTSGYTEDEIPGAVSDVEVTEDTDVMLTLTWSQPVKNSKCVDYYIVCFRLEGETEKYCVESNTTQVSVTGLSACGNYYVEVTPATSSDMLGDASTTTFRTHDAVPGEPQNVVVGLITEDTIQLLWDHPTKNFLCLVKYDLTIGEVRVLRSWNSVQSRAPGFDNEFTFTPLFPCADFIIEVASVNAAEQSSPKVPRYASTEDTDPLPPSNVIVTPNGPSSIDVSWSENENDRCAGSFEVCWNDGVHPVESCETIGAGGDNSLIIYDLLPCTNYDIIVSVMSENGTFVSNSTGNSTSTADVRPGPVVDLKFTDVEAHQLTISCKPPANDPQCVKEIITRITDNDQRLQWKATETVFEETITGLDACTDYTVQVFTVSPTGLESPVEEIREKTLDDLPSAPQAFGVNDFTTTSITLQWFQPVDNPRCVTEYVLTWGDTVSNSTVNVDGSTFKMEYTVDGLTACTKYFFSLISDSLAGVSDQTTLTQETAC